MLDLTFPDKRSETNKPKRLVHLIDADERDRLFLGPNDALFLPSFCTILLCGLAGIQNALVAFRMPPMHSKCLESTKNACLVIGGLINV